MSQRDLLRLVLANLNRMRARVALTAVGVVIGTAAVVVLISLGVGLQESTSASIGQFGDLTTVQVFAGAPFGAAGGQAADEPDVVLDDAALRELRALEHVTAVTPQEGLQGSAELSFGRLTASPRVVGIDPDAADALGWTTVVGAPRVGRGQIVLGARVLERATSPRAARQRERPARTSVRPTPEPPPPDEVGGRTVRLTVRRFTEQGEVLERTERLRVAGVREEVSGSDDFTVYMALADVEAFNQWLTGQRRDPREGYRDVIVRVDDRANVSDVQAEIDALGYETFSSQEMLEGVNTLFLIVQAVLGGVGGIALLVAAFGIANTMTMAIYERTREIGIMKAIGATNGDVLRVFLFEAGAIGLLGGTLGVLIGWALGWGIDIAVRAWMQAQQGAPSDDPLPHIVVTPSWLLAFALGFATVVGLVSGAYPALRAASMKPLRALRSE